MVGAGGEQFQRELTQELDDQARDLLTAVNTAWDDWVQESGQDHEEIEAAELEVINRRLNGHLVEAARAMQARVEAGLEVLRNRQEQEFRREKEAWDNWVDAIKQEQEQYPVLLEKLTILAEKVKARLALLPDDQLAGLPEAYRYQAEPRKHNLEIISRMFAALPEYYRSRAPLFQTEPQPLAQPLELGAVPAVAPPNADLPKWPDLVASWLEVPRSFLRSFADRAVEKYGLIRDKNYRLSRQTEELLDRLRRANEDFLKKSLLPAVDGIERGKSPKSVVTLTADLSPEQATLWQAAMDIYEELDASVLGFLESVAIRRLEARRGEAFDVNFHNPVFLEETSEMEPGRILETARSGYIYRDELLRPVDVILAKKISGGSDDGSQEAERRG